MCWPTWMEHIKAKSEDMGGQTLAQHTWDVLSRMADQRRLHPHLSSAVSDRVWAQAFWAAFLHDFGKAAAGFQDVLRGVKGPWSERRHRHEVLSLAFLDWLFPAGHPDRDTILAMVVCHHKDADIIFSKYGGESKLSAIRDRAEADSIKQMLQELDNNISIDIRTDLWRWVDECALEWAAELGFTGVEKLTLISLEQAQSSGLAQAIYNALRDFHRLCQGITIGQMQQLLLLRGLILTADHTASAGVERFPPMPLTRSRAEAPLRSRGHGWRDHQITASETDEGSAILIAPTGSGKTEAALLWAANQLEKRPASRLFYTLPYQASMNAMYERLAADVLGYDQEQIKAGDVDTITICHSRALLKLYQDMMSLDEADPKQAVRQARWLRNKADLNTYPIQVFSPYQMLKAAYSLKGFETLVLDYTHALFIFDEIHAYDPKRLALIVEFMRWLREGFGARFLVMTATLPPVLMEKLMDALSPEIITATPAEFKRSRRHTVEILDGRLCDEIITRVHADWLQGKAVLVCLNRVADAQRVYIALRDNLGLRPDEDIVLLHGRFNGQDRKRKEDILLQRAGVRQADRRPFVCVATQVVEVSLNVDFDTLYSDPAPLEALLQRFGRVNRGRSEGSCLPVHVFTQPSGEGDKPYLPYDQLLVERSLQVLTNYCGDGRDIDEAQVTTMLGDIYTGQILEEWEQKYHNSRNKFKRDVLDKIKPFASADKNLQKQFYNLFDGIEVLPEQLMDDYYTAREAGGYLEASQYLVNITYAIYKEFEGYCKITPARGLEGEYADHIHVTYSQEYGLDIDAARRAARAEHGQDVRGDDSE
jgi:CRISPR-associated endonuclease/helicase Cas3